MTTKQLNELSYSVKGCAFQVHTELGPGLFESTYESCMDYLLRERRYDVKRQSALPVIFRDVKLNNGYRIDPVVEDKHIIEIKSIDTIAPIHEALLLTYLMLSNIKLGLMINSMFQILNTEFLEGSWIFS